MKLQHLAVIFIIIILPITLLLNGYTESQIKTLRLQLSYDGKLNTATYDALKAFQLNTMNSDTSDLANSKIRDIEASANTFFSSVASNFNMAGYNKDILKEYVPALVYTMYDGYYIYSPYTNTLDDTNENMEGDRNLGSDAEILNPNNHDATYKQEEKITGLKPYIYYSCRYVHGEDDFVITYSLDNYITIQGQIGGGWVYDCGYLLDNVTVSPSGNYSYRNVPIDQTETLSETIYNPVSGRKIEYEYIKINGVKYYKEVNNGEVRWFSLLNGEIYYQDDFDPQTTSAKEYYKKALEFKNNIQNVYHLGDLTNGMARDENGNPISTFTGNTRVFDFNNGSGVSIEDPNSEFNQHRLAVIRYVIERNLSIAIANYNSYSGGITTNFQMPKLQEHEWEKIINNVSIISFLQGLNIGGKIYNGYSIITNDKNEELVKENSIYIATNDNQYHRITDSDLTTKNEYKSNVYGALNVDFDRKFIDPKGGRK